MRQEVAASEAAPVDPADALAAVVHPDPYRFYARLVAERPLHRDEALGLWVASGAEAVAEVLGHPRCRVRPSPEAVPGALVGSPAGEIFRGLVRMSDADRQRAFKPAVVAALDGVASSRLASAAERWAAHLAGGLAPEPGAARLAEFAFALPVHVMGDLLGLAGEGHHELGPLVGALVRCVFPGGTLEHVERGKAAAGRLLELVRGRLAAAGPEEAPLLLALAAQARPGADLGELVVPNAIGFLVQAHEATAALINATLLTLTRRPTLLSGIGRSPRLLDAVVDEVARFDAPVQNTRRFVAEDAIVAGQSLRTGDVVLVVLAAANRDPRANPAPETFDPERRGARVFSFGLGQHSCPGRRFAVSIAASGVRQLLARGVDPRPLDARPPYRPSSNCRMPLLGAREMEAQS